MVSGVLAVVQTPLVQAASSAPSLVLHPVRQTADAVRSIASLNAVKALNGLSIASKAGAPGPTSLTATGTSDSGLQVTAAFPAMSLQAQVQALGSDQEMVPPDTQIAAGPSQEVEVDNAALSVWSPQGSLLDTVDLNTFFNVATGYHITDPRVIYDQLSGRWLVSATSFDQNGNSTVYLAVSQSGDPTQGWNIYQVAADTNGILYDQPKLGVSSSLIVISWDDYTHGTFSGAQTWVLQKSAALSGATLNSVGFGPSLTAFSIVPSISTTPTSTEWLVYNDSDPSIVESTGAPTIGVIAITGTPADNNVTWTQQNLPITPTRQPPPAVEPPGGQPIATNDSRFLSAIWQNGTLWTGGNDGVTPPGSSSEVSGARLIELSTTGANAVVEQDFTVAYPGVSLNFPAVTLDGAGDLFVGVTVSSANQYPSAAVFGQLAGSSPGTVTPLKVFSAGQADFSCTGGCATSSNGDRWGDYSGASPDPGHPHHAWVAAEFMGSAPKSVDWSTAAARVELVDPNRLASFHITASTSSVGVGQPVQFVITALNANGSPLSSFSGPVSLTSSDPSASLPSSLTWSSGTATISVTFNTPGAQTLTVSAGSISATSTPEDVVPLKAPVASGNFVQMSGQAPVFWDQAGVLYHVPDPAVFIGMGGQWNNIQTVTSFTGDTLGLPMVVPYPSGTVIQDQSTGQSYFLMAGVLHPLTDANPGSHPVVTVPALMPNWPIGPAVSGTGGYYPTGSLWRAANQSSVYVVSGGALHHIVSAAVFLGMGEHWNNIQVVSSLPPLPVAGPWSTPVPVLPTGALVRQAGTSAVYVEQNGVLRHIVSPAQFTALGFSWSAVDVLPSLAGSVFGPDLGSTGL